MDHLADGSGKSSEKECEPEIVFESLEIFEDQ